MIYSKYVSLKTVTKRLALVPQRFTSEEMSIKLGSISKAYRTILGGRKHGLISTHKKGRTRIYIKNFKYL